MVEIGLMKRNVFFTGRCARKEGCNSETECTESIEEMKRRNGEACPCWRNAKVHEIEIDKRCEGEWQRGALYLKAGENSRVGKKKVGAPLFEGEE